MATDPCKGETSLFETLTNSRSMLVFGGAGYTYDTHYILYGLPLDIKKHKENIDIEVGPQQKT